MNHAVIFDMDGLLIDSEPLWQAAQWDVFTSLGVPLTPAMACDMVGRRVRDHVAHWYALYPWRSHSLLDVEREITRRALALILERGVACPGAIDAVRMLSARGIPLAVASSSPSAIISAVLERLQIASLFQWVQSAELEPFGKPHPGVYLTTANCLGIPPTGCVAIEDSVNGVAAAKAAGMACITVPALGSGEDPRFAIADDILISLEHLDDALLDRLLGAPVA